MQRYEFTYKTLWGLSIFYLRSKKIDLFIYKLYSPRSATKIVYHCWKSARAWNLLQMVASYFLENQHFLGILSSKMKSTHGKPMCGVYLWHRVCIEIEEMDNPYAQLNNLKKSHVYDFWIVQACIHIGCCTSCVVLEIVMVPTMCFWTTSYSRSEEALCTTGVSKRHQTLTFSPKHWAQYCQMLWQE